MTLETGDMWTRFGDVDLFCITVNGTFKADGSLAMGAGIAEKAVERIQTDPKTRFLVGNPTTGGFGLTLTACNTVVYYSNSYNLEVRMQSEDRAHRMGQKGTVVYIDIVAKGTLDEAIMKSLTSKGKLAAKTLGEEELKSWLL